MGLGGVVECESSASWTYRWSIFAPVVRLAYAYRNVREEGGPQKLEGGGGSDTGLTIVATDRVSPHRPYTVDLHPSSV